MGIDWMNYEEISQAVPPAYARWLGEHAREELTSRRREIESEEKI